MGLTHEDFMREALQEAALSPGEVPVGAVIVLDGQIIARAHNERENESHDPFAHAELVVMKRAAQKLGRRRLTGCRLYVTLEPCPMCAGAMVMACLDACYFGAFDRKQGCCGSVYDLANEQSFYHRLPCYGGILENESAALLQAFFDDKRRHIVK